MTDSTADVAVPVSPRRLSQILDEVANDTSRERVSVGDLFTAMNDRATGALMFIFALPNVLPTPPGTSSILGAPLIFLAFQLAFGMRPWLPQLIAQRSISRPAFAAMMKRAKPWLDRSERLLRPRLIVMARPPAEYLTGSVALLLAVILVLPIPLGNMLPALAICLLGLGVLERDGLAILAGMAFAAISVALVSGVIYALLKAAYFIATHAFPG